MSTSNLLRISGLVLMLAAAMFVVAEMLAFSILLREEDASDLRSFATSNTFILQSLLTLLAGILLLGGLVGLYVNQSEAAGKLGLFAFFLAFLGTALVTGDFYVNTVVTPMVAMEVPAFLDNPLSGFLQAWLRSEEHTSELQSRQYLVCRLLLEKKTWAPPTFSCTKT